MRPWGGRVSVFLSRGGRESLTGHKPAKLAWQHDKVDRLKPSLCTADTASCGLRAGCRCSPAVQSGAICKYSADTVSVGGCKMESESKGRWHQRLHGFVRDPGIEPGSVPWQGTILPLNQPRFNNYARPG